MFGCWKNHHSLSDMLMETGGEIGSKTPSSLLMSSSVAPFLAPFPSKLGNHRENAGTPNNQPHIHPKKVGIYWVYPLSPRAPTGGYPTGRVIVHHLDPITGQPIIDCWCCWRFFGGHRTRGVRHKKLRESRSQVIFPSRKIQVTQRCLWKNLGKIGCWNIPKWNMPLKQKTTTTCFC